MEELIDAGDLVIASTVMRGRGRVSGADVTDAYVFVAKLGDGLIVEGLGVGGRPSDKKPSKPWGWRSRRCRRRTWSW